MRPADLDAVTIDAYGTLVVLADPVPALTEGLRALGVDCDADSVGRAFAMEVAYYRERSHEGRDDATLHALRRACVGVILDELGSEVDPADFVDGFVAAMRFELLPGARAAVERLRRLGLELAVVSNWDIGLRAQLDGLGLDGLAVVTSAEAGAPKPDPAVFLRALERLGVRPERALHVGDSDADEEGANAAGMQFAPAPLERALEALA
ncbi:MAG TPA: HAD-IA family hydrolase [Gaiellaceae bacterium]|nr:HAD-IA family hydrolase [Gaiellaceae bacterium]